LHEHKVLDWQMIDTMVKDDEAEASTGFGGYRWPEHQVRERRPYIYICLFSLNFLIHF
jgi:hypothetical protein